MGGDDSRASTCGRGGLDESVLARRHRGRSGRRLVCHCRALTSFVRGRHDCRRGPHRWRAIAVMATVVLAVTDGLVRRLSPLGSTARPDPHVPGRCTVTVPFRLRNIRLDSCVCVSTTHAAGSSATPRKQAAEPSSTRRRAQRPRPDHAGPLERVRAYSRTIGEELGLNERDWTDFSGPGCYTTSASCSYHSDPQQGGPPDRQRTRHPQKASGTRPQPRHSVDGLAR